MLDVTVSHQGAIPWPCPADGVLSDLRDEALTGIEAGTFRTWTFRTHAEPRRLLDAVGLHDVPNINRGFWPIPEIHGRGYATEASEANAFF